MLSKQLLPATLAFLVAIGGVGAVSTVAGAQSARAIGPTPPRLALTDGEVSFWRPGAEDWGPAQVNTALAAGDSLYAGDRANLEVQIGPRAFVRAGANTELGVESLETGYLQLKVTSGHAAIDLKRLPEGQRVEVDTPNGAFVIARAGYYRVDIDDSTTFTTRRGGAATVIPAGGEETYTSENQQIVLEGTETATVTTNPAPDVDEWDRWNYDRTAPLGEQPPSAQYVPPDVAGVDDLDRHGEWRDTPRYGHVWVPREVAPDWAPYTTGRWVWDPYYGWTWVDDAPWGWAPYHYGRWCWVDGYWGWAPGPVTVAPVYAPALVAFFGPHVGVSVGIGSPFVSWVALGFGEPVVPWWGPIGFTGRPSWGGWGGPRIVNNVVINNTKIVNVRNITTFQNVHVHHAVVGVDRDRFGRGGGQHVRLTPAQTEHLQPVRGRLEVKPVAASLVPKTGHAQRPPDRIQGRPVVATRPPTDPARRLRDAGLAPTGAVKAVQPRIVQPRHGARNEPDQEMHIDRTTPPPHGRPAIGTPGEAAPPPPLGGHRERMNGGTQPVPAPRGHREPANGGAEGVPPPRGEHTGRPHEPRIDRGAPPPESHGSPTTRTHDQAPPPLPPRGHREPANGGAEGAPPPRSEHTGRPHERNLDRGEPPPSSGRHPAPEAPPSEQRMQHPPQGGRAHPPHDTHQEPGAPPPRPPGPPQTLTPRRPPDPSFAARRPSRAPAPRRSSTSRPSSERS